MDSLEEQLYCAVSKGNHGIVDQLLSQGVNVNAVCSSGRTPLGKAAQIGNLKILKMLLDASNIAYLSTSCKQDIEHQQRSNKKQKDSSEGRISGSLRCAADGQVRNRKRTSRLTEEVDSKNHSDVACDCASAHLCTAVSDCQYNEKQNLGYFIVVHKDGSILQSPGSEGQETQRAIDENWNQHAAECHQPGCQSSIDTAACALNDVKTPDGMDALEWDVEVQGKEKTSEREDDSWASLYQWYAEILDKTGSLLQLPQPCDVNHQDVYGRCAIHYAAEQGHIDALHLLVSAGCRADLGDLDNLTPLHLAVSRNHFEISKLLLGKGAEVNRKTSDKTSALHIAASRGYIETVRVLLQSGAKIDSLDASDRTPLMLAVSRGHEALVELLIKHGAKVNIEEIHGYTPLCEAVWQTQVPLVQLLLSAGAKITQSHYLLHYAVIHRHLEMAALLLNAGSIVNLRDDNGDSPLIIAAKIRNCQIAELLLRNGAAVNYPNALTGSMPLHEAVEYSREANFSAFESMFQLFQAYGAVLNVQTCTGGDTPLFRAILLEKYKAAALLIRHGADVNLCNVESCVVDNLFLARKRNNFPLSRMIVYAGFDIQHCTPGLEPVHAGEQHSVDDLRGWLRYMKYNPMPLADLCRLVVRRQLGECVYKRINHIYLPPALKRYILLEDIDVNEGT